MTLPATVEKNPDNQASHISRVAREGIKAFDIAMTSDDVMAAVKVSEYIEELRGAIEPHMDSILKLQDSSLGFRTDRSPAIIEANKRKKKGAMEPYSREVVKECAIEALLRGVKLVGDQFNIISGRCYIPINGYKFLLNCTDAGGLKYSITKVSVTDSEHVAEGKAAWTLDGKPYEMVKRFFCKAYGSITTWEQTEGKATRKLLKAVYERITSRAFHDDDEGIRDEDAIEVESKVVDEPSEPTEPDPEPERDIAAELLGRMGDDEIHPHEFLSHMHSKKAIDPGVTDVNSLVRLNPGFCKQLLGSWEKSSKAYKKAKAEEAAA